MKAPFPYFGGKSRIAPAVWERLGETPNYIEPFFGSGAVLLARPWGAARWETVNDVDALLCNFWRAVQAEPEEVAALLDWPINETDQHARHRWLCAMPGKADFARRMTEDPDLYDVRRAAWWCWLASQWIGAGLCAGEWHGPDDDRNAGRGVCNDTEKMPLLKRAQGCQCRPPAPTLKVPNLRQAKGCQCRPAEPWLQRPQLKGAMGCQSRPPAPHLKLPELNHAKGCQTAAEPWLQLPDLNHPKGIQTRRDSLAQWMQALAARLRGVRVCCGDWQRICGDSPTIHCATPVAVFLDPPYDVTRRDKEIYAQDAPGLAAAVREWALNRGDDPRFRIALCGLEGEHPMPPSWECLAWKAGGGYANIHETKGRGLTNRHRERVWFSPHCFRPELAGVTMAGLGRVANEASE